MKKVAMFIDSLSGGGAEKVVMTLAQAMKNKGSKVTLFVLDNIVHYDIPPALSLSVVYLQSNSKEKTKGWFNRNQQAQKLTELVNKQIALYGQFDLFLVHLQESYRIVSACDFSPVFYVVHNSLKETLEREKKLGPLKYFYLKSALKKLQGKHLITVSKGIENELNHSSLFSPVSIQTIYNPFDFNEITLLANKPEPSIPKDKYLIHVGRFARQKRHDILFSALTKIPEDYKLVCLCRASGKLTALIQEYGLEERIIVTGFVQNPYPWIKNAKLLVLSSDYEGLPTVLIEAFACDTPVVSTNCPHGPDEIMRGPHQQYLVPRRDPEQLAHKINQALNSNVKLAPPDILHQLEAENITQQYLDLAAN